MIGLFMPDSLLLIRKFIKREFVFLQLCKKLKGITLNVVIK